MIGKGFRTGDSRRAFGPARISFAIDNGLTRRSPMRRATAGPTSIFDLDEVLSLA